MRVDGSCAAVGLRDTSLRNSHASELDLEPPLDNWRTRVIVLVLWHLLVDHDGPSLADNLLERGARELVKGVELLRDQTFVAEERLNGMPAILGSDFFLNLLVGLEVILVGIAVGVGSHIGERSCTRCARVQMICFLPARYALFSP